MGARAPAPELLGATAGATLSTAATIVQLFAVLAARVCPSIWQLGWAAER